MTDPRVAEQCVIPAERLSEFWRGIYPDGMTIQQVCNELHDLQTVSENVPKVYCHVTGGRISKANTLADAVIAEHDEYVQRLMDEAKVDER